jgi:ubiquinone/menaquinone biosynthesis C-methylase UbiE
LSTDLDSHKDVVRRHFDGYAGKWHERLNDHPFRSRFDVVSRLVAPLKKDVVLDIGCGTGDYCQLFSPDQTDYLGIDLAPEMVRRCQELYPHFRFLVGDGDSVSAPDNSSDIVLDIAVIEYYEDPMPHMRELARVTKPGGYVVCAVPNGSNVTKGWNTAWGRVVRALKGERRDVASTKDPRVQHRFKTPSDMKALANLTGLEMVDWQFANVMLVPEVHGLAGRFNRALSGGISGRSSWRWLSGWSATILICLMRKP